MPEVTGGWPEEGAQYAPGAPMEPVQQAYPQQAQYQTQQAYPQQGYPDQQYQQPQQQYPQQQPYPQEQTVPQQAMFAEEEQSSLPSEFDHLFRDSSPEDRRAISGRQPMVSGPGASPSPGFQQQTQQAPPQQMQATQLAPQQQYGQPQQQDYGQPGGYDNGPFSYEGGGGGNGNRRTPLIIGAVVAVVAVVGLYLGLSGGGGSGKASASSTSSSTAAAKSNETAQQEADAVYQLVTQAKQLREDIVGEVSKLRSCDIADAQSQLNTTATARQNAATKVATLPVDKISGASAVLTALQKGWQDSATSDADYAKAAADFASGGCSESKLKKDANYQAAQDTSSTADKNTAANLWNSIMTKYEPSVSGDDL
jgi:hypothetical protein